MTHPESNRLENSAKSHEMQDVRARPMAIFAVCFVASLVLVHLVGWSVWVIVQRYEDAQLRATFPMHPLAAAMRSAPPGPLQEPQPAKDVLPRADLQDVRARADALIGTGAWGWADAKHHFARIPVDDAIAMAVSRGLPEMLPATQPTTQPFMAPASALHGPGGVP